MKGLFKGLAGTLAIAAITLFVGTETFAATGMYVGKDVSAEGTTVIGVSIEGELGMASVPVVIEKGVIRKGDVIESGNGYKYEMPDDHRKDDVIYRHERVEQLRFKRVRGFRCRVYKYGSQSGCRYRGSVRFGRCIRGKDGNDTRFNIKDSERSGNASVLIIRRKRC